MNLIDWVGTAAAILTTASFVPQAWHTFRTRDVSGISLGMYSLFTVGVALWLVYGVLMVAWPIIIANTGGRPLQAVAHAFPFGGAWRQLHPDLRNTPRIQIAQHAEQIVCGLLRACRLGTPDHTCARVRALG
jgi:MtN3 and saliva related transmembrane protein